MLWNHQETSHENQTCNYQPRAILPQRTGAGGLDDALIDSGHEVRVDTAVEDMRDNRADVAVPLTTEGAGKPVSGRGYVRSFRYDF